MSETLESSMSSTGVAEGGVPPARSSSARRFGIILYTLISLVQGPVIGGAVVKWAQSWWFNRSSMLMLTFVNTSLTAGTEIVSRTISAPLTNDPRDHGFFVTDDSGHTRIHRQSMINILMTFFASMLGGPVYFMRRRLHRFVFFVTFGVSNSFLSQALQSSLCLGAFAIAGSRLAFDFFYNGTVKFILFEVARPAIMRVRRNFFAIGAVRGIQDFSTTFFRVVVLNFLGFKG